MIQSLTKHKSSRDSLEPQINQVKTLSKLNWTTNQPNQNIVGAKTQLSHKIQPQIRISATNQP